MLLFNHLKGTIFISVAFTSIWVCLYVKNHALSQGAMDVKKLLVENRKEHLKFILKQINKTEESLNQDVDLIKAWVKTQPHLPEMPSDAMIINFLFFNKFSIENAKRKIDMYYSLRPLLPEIYENKNPKLPHMKDVVERVYTFALPKVTDMGYRVSVAKILDENPDRFDPYHYFGLGYNTVEIRLQEDIMYGDIIINDLEHVKLGHLLKFTPICLKKAVVVLEEVYSNRVRGIHFVNSPPFLDTLMTILKPLLKPKIQQRIHVHKKTDELLKFFPKRILPKDYGGDELSLSELNELWKQKYVEYQDRFDTLEKLRTDENLRPSPLVDDEILGFYGNFKKLNVD